MFVFDVLRKEKVYQIVESDLRSYGVKYRHKKNAVKTQKPERNGKLPQKVFKTHLSCLPLDLVNLSSGAMVHVPVFVSQATSYLLQHIDLEGIFRKAGSKARQREISARVDNGGTLGNKDHGIDIANCLKTFFRDLPEPLIPYAFHDLFVRCVVLKKNRVEALLLACLLLPPHHLNTLVFLMEFLKKVASYDEFNKMGVGNLATVFGPNIMPLGETTMVAVQSRLETHLMITQLLIENAEKIGILPNHVAESIASDCEKVGSAKNELHRSDSNLTKSIKKKHRSGSFTRKPNLSASNLNLRMLSSLKKMVGKNNSPQDTEPISESSNSVFLSTPSLKIGKKRKVVEATNDETNLKKNNDFLEVMPERIALRSRYAFVSPVCKHPKKSFDKTEKSKKVRLSFDRFVSRGRQKTVETEAETSKEEPNPVRGRSWTIASRHSESKKKRRSDEFTHRSLSREKKIPKLNSQKECDDIFMDANINLSDVGAELASREDKRPKVKSRRRTSDVHVTNKSSRDHNSTLPSAYTNEYVSNDETSLESSSDCELKNNQDEEYVKIPKSEYLEIKNRVSVIESRISQEFKCIANESRENLTPHSFTKVQAEYEKTLVEASIGNTVNADHLAKRLGKELKIRRKSEHKIIRSPSARRIGVLRRKSQEKPVSKPVSRTSSWHISDRTEPQSLRETTLKMNNFYSNTNLNHSPIVIGYSKSEDLGANSLETDLFCSEKTNARLTYLHEQLRTLITHTDEHTKDSLSDEDFNLIDDDVFQPVGNKINLNLKVRKASSFHGSEFIDNSRYFNERVKELKKSNSQQNVILNNECLSSEKNEKVVSWKDAEKYFRSEGQIAIPVPTTGRPSVAKLRTQNAGMVLAKAKFFDETTKTSNHSEISTERKIIHNQDTSRRQSARIREIKSLDLDTTDSPRRAVFRKKMSMSPKTPSAKVRIMKSPNTIKMELTLIPSQETVLHRKYNDAKRASNYQKENKGMKTPLTRKKTKILQESPRVYNSDMNYKTPLIKKPLTVKTPRSAKSLSRRPAVEVRRTPLRAIGPLATPKRQSPRSILKTSHMNSRRFT